MRRFTRRTSLRRSKKSPTQWVTFTWAGNTLGGVAANTLSTLPLVSTGKSQLTTGGDTFLMTQRFTVLRIVGDLIIENTAAVVSLYSWGVIVSDEIAGVTDTFDPTVLLNADKSWLYLKHGALSGLGGAGTYGFINTQEGGGQAHFDIRVKRVLKPDQQLNLFFIASQASNVALNARCLVSRTA